MFMSIRLTAAAALLAVAQIATATPSAPVATPATTETIATDGFYEPGRDSDRRPAAATAADGAQILTTAEPLATAAGIELLNAGGSAADAAMAALLALSVVEPQSSGLGGGAFLLWHDGADGQTFSIDAREKAPVSARPDRFLRPDGTPMAFADAVPGGKSVGVPGLVALLADMHQRWGRRPWAAAFQPAIRLARDGFPVTARLHEFSTAFQSMLQQSPAAARIFLDADGQAWPIGHMLKQPELADTLEHLAKEGPEAFYHGPIATKISKTVASAFANPAELSVDDLAEYTTVARDPLCTNYRQWQICSMGPPSSGGIAVLQILKQLERFDLAALGADNLLSQHLFAESQRLAYADRAVWGADSDFVDVPDKALISDNYLNRRSALIQLHKAMPEVAAGQPEGISLPTARPLADVPGTTHIGAADAAGNVVSITSTIEGPFGSGLMAAGFLLNNELTDFDFAPVRTDGTEAANAVRPGQRPRSSMAPTIVLDQEGRAVAAFGAAGGATIIAQVAKALIAHLDWGLSVEDSLALPQLVADDRGIRLERNSRLETMAAGLRALGHARVTTAVLPLKGNGLVRHKGGWRGAADPRSDGQAMGTDQP